MAFPSGINRNLQLQHLNQRNNMFSVKQKREISDAVQRVLRETNHPELPPGEIWFELHVYGAESWSYADIKNNGAVTNPVVNPWNESQDKPKE